ncbi:type I restriction-modification system subunit M [Deinococcus yunweiensis]|uniref:type I restriction-modification system subunit M n=1 Tax=Deinococcus yunweiensis TaxID=367282 RepID=UPI00398EFBB7
MTNLNPATFVWSIADLLRGPYKQSDYGKVILPFAVLFRLDAVLVPTKPAILEVLGRFPTPEQKPPDDLLTLASGFSFYNTSRMTLADVIANPAGVLGDLTEYIGAFSPNVRDIFERYDTLKQVRLLEERGLLYNVLQKFATADLSPARVNNQQMGALFEELIRRFAELSNETAGEHYTAREVIQLMVALLFTEDDEALSIPGTVRSVYDPTAGTGGMLAISEEYVREHNPGARLALFGQELNDESYAICKADLLIKGYAAGNIRQGNTLKKDLHLGMSFDYVLSNPPFGVDWLAAEPEVRAEHLNQGAAGRFGPGLPRKNDGAMLFLLHGLSKLRPVTASGTGGGRMAIVLPGGPMFIGGPGSGESEIRRHIIENDLLEAIVALPGDLFYNTPLSTYIWVLTNRKAEHRKGTVQLINGAGLSRKMRKSLGSKRVELGENDIARIVREHGTFRPGELSRIVPNQALGYRTITLERPLRRSYHVTAARVLRLDADPKLGALPNLDAIKAALLGMGDEVVTRQSEFVARVELALYGLGLKKPQLRAIAELMGERDEHGEISTDAKGQPIADPDLRDTEDVPLTETIEAYVEREVRAYAPDAWVSAATVDPKDGLPGKVGYEIPFNQFFYRYEPPRPLDEISRDLRALSAEVMDLLAEVVR